MADVTLPQLGETVTEGTITQWFKQVGDTVAADEPLFEVSTDKVDTEVPSPVAGTLTEIRVQEGETVEVGTVIAVVGDGDGAPRRRRRRPPRRRRPRRRRAEEAPAEEAPRRSPSRGGRRAEAPAAEHRAGAGRPRRRRRAAEPAPAARAGARRRPTPSAAKGILLSPVVRRLVNEHGLDPAAITGTGPGGRITRDDVLDHIDKAGAQAGRRRQPRRRPTPRRRRRRRPRRRHRRRAGAAPATPPAPAPDGRRRASATRRSSCRRSASSPATTW